MADVQQNVQNQINNDRQKILVMQGVQEKFDQFKEKQKKHDIYTESAVLHTTVVNDAISNPAVKLNEHVVQSKMLIPADQTHVPADAIGAIPTAALTWFSTLLWLLSPVWTYAIHPFYKWLRPDTAEDIQRKQNQQDNAVFLAFLEASLKQEGYVLRRSKGFSRTRLFGWDFRFLTGFGGGALVGMAIGSIILPVIGSAIGAVIGGLSGAAAVLHRPPAPEELLPQVMRDYKRYVKREEIAQTADEESLYIKDEGRELLRESPHDIPWYIRLFTGAQFGLVAGGTIGLIAPIPGGTAMGAAAGILIMGGLAVLSPALFAAMRKALGRQPVPKVPPIPAANVAREHQLDNQATKRRWYTLSTMEMPWYVRVFCGGVSFATIGSIIGTFIFPGIGTAIGGVIGLGVGIAAAYFTPQVLPMINRRRNNVQNGADIELDNLDPQAQREKAHNEAPGNLDMPWYTRALAGVLGGSGIGAGIGAVIGTFIFPGIGTAAGVALGGVIGALAGFTIAIANPLISAYARKWHLMAPSAPAGGLPWFVRATQGSLLGGILGATLGSVVPGLGTLLGGAIGSLIGATYCVLKPIVVEAYKNWRDRRNGYVLVPENVDDPVGVPDEEQLNLDDSLQPLTAQQLQNDAQGNGNGNGNGNDNDNDNDNDQESSENRIPEDVIQEVQSPSTEIPRSSSAPSLGHLVAKNLSAALHQNGPGESRDDIEAVRQKKQEQLQQMTGSKHRLKLSIPDQTTPVDKIQEKQRSIDPQLKLVFEPDFPRQQAYQPYNSLGFQPLTEKREQQTLVIIGTGNSNVQNFQLR